MIPAAIAVPAAAQIGGSIISGIFGSNSAKAANKAAGEIAQKQMDFQERMSNTQHQRQVADLRAAGLNPRLSAMGGGGASSPAGASSPVLDTGAAGVSAANSAVAAVKTAYDIQNMKETNKQIASQTNLNKAAAATQLADAMLKTNSAGTVAAQNRILDSQLPGKKLQAEWDQSKPGRFFFSLDQMIKSISPFGSSAKSISEIPK